MTNEEAIEILKDFEELNPCVPSDKEAVNIAIKALEQEPCEMTVEEYRQRMIQAFHNADCDELIAICALPTEKEFEHLEWLLKNHYKKEPCDDAISRQAAIDAVRENTFRLTFAEEQGYEGHVAWSAKAVYSDVIEGALLALPPVNPQYTEAEIQKMQELEQAEIQKAYELGKAEQSKMGHWIRCGDSSYIYECSECKDTVWANKDADRTWKCCPNCGCRMSEGSE